MTGTNPIRLVALDLDGTLLNENFELTERVRESVQRARGTGLQIVIATGRDRRSAEPFLRELDLERLLITSGGALVWVDGQIIAHNCFTPSQIAAIFRIGQEYQTGFFVDQPAQTWTFGNLVYLEQYAHLSDSLPSVQIESLLDPPPLKVALVQEHDILEEIREKLSRAFPELNMVFPFENIMDVNPSGTDKGLALTRLSRELGIPMHEVAAVGDSENDVSMFAASGLSFAMGNAPKHVQRSADQVLPPNDRDGLVQGLEFILSRNARSAV